MILVCVWHCSTTHTLDALCDSVLEHAHLNCAFFFTGLPGGSTAFWLSLSSLFGLTHSHTHPHPSLSFSVPPSQKFEEIYLKECAKSRPAPEAKFNYAWALIRSPARPDIRKGVIMMSGLLEDRFSDRDCLYYMAHGHYRLDDVVVCWGYLPAGGLWGGRAGVNSSGLDVGEDLAELAGVVFFSVLCAWYFFSPAPVAHVNAGAAPTWDLCALREFQAGESFADLSVLRFV